MTSDSDRAAAQVPPAWAQWVLSLVLPRATEESVSGDLIESHLQASQTRRVRRRNHGQEHLERNAEESVDGKAVEAVHEIYHFTIAPCFYGPSRSPRIRLVVEVGSLRAAAPSSL